MWSLSGFSSHCSLQAFCCFCLSSSESCTGFKNQQVHLEREKQHVLTEQRAIMVTPNHMCVSGPPPSRTVSLPGRDLAWPGPGKSQFVIWNIQVKEPAATGLQRLRNPLRWVATDRVRNFRASFFGNEEILRLRSSFSWPCALEHFESRRLQVCSFLSHYSNRLGFFLVFFPKQCVTLRGSYGKSSLLGLGANFGLFGFHCAGFQKSCLWTSKFAFRLRQTLGRQGQFRRRVLACAPCRFSEIGKCAKRDDSFERCAKSSQRLVFFWKSVVKNVNFLLASAVYLALLKSVSICSKRSFRETVVEFDSAMSTSFRVAVTGLRMPRSHFFVAGAVLVSQNADLDFVRATFSILSACWISARAALCGVRACRIALVVARCRFWLHPRDPLRDWCVSNRSRCSAVLILYRIHRYGY